MLYCVTSVVCPPRPKEQLPGSQVSLPLTSRPPLDSPPPNYATGTRGKYSSFSLGATWVWGHSQHKCVARNCIGTVCPIVSRNIIRAGTVTLATNLLLSYSFNHLPYFNSPSFPYSYTLLQAKSAARLSVQLLSKPFCHPAPSPRPLQGTSLPHSSSLPLPSTSQLPPFGLKKFIQMKSQNIWYQFHGVQL